MPESESTNPDKREKSKAKAGKRARKARGATTHVAFPKHAISQCLRIPEAVLEQNAGKECTYREAAKFAGIGYTGQIGVEISSALKYGLFERTAPGKIKPTDLVRRIVRPQSPTDKRNAMREAALNAPEYPTPISTIAVSICRTLRFSRTRQETRCIFRPTMLTISFQCSFKASKTQSCWKT